MRARALLCGLLLKANRSALDTSVSANKEMSARDADLLGLVIVVTTLGTIMITVVTTVIDAMNICKRKARVETENDGGDSKLEDELPMEQPENGLFAAMALQRIGENEPGMFDTKMAAVQMRTSVVARYIKTPRNSDPA